MCVCVVCVGWTFLDHLDVLRVRCGGDELRVLARAVRFDLLQVQRLAPDVTAEGSGDAPAR